MKDKEINELMEKLYTIELKNCPWCGEQPDIIANKNRIHCSNDACVHPVTAYYARWSSMFKEWNTRKDRSKK